VTTVRFPKFAMIQGSEGPDLIDLDAHAGIFEEQGEATKAEEGEVEAYVRPSEVVTNHGSSTASLTAVSVRTLTTGGPGAFKSETSRGTSQERPRGRQVLKDSELRSSDMVQDLLTFEGNESLLRGSSLSVVLRGCGSIFKNSKGSAKTYQLSQVVAGIDSFVSHNWTVPRKTKYLALVYHYFFARSIVGPLVLLVIIGVLYATTDVLPKVLDKSEVYSPGCMARILIIPVHLFTLFIYSDLRSCFGVRGSCGRFTRSLPF